MIDTHCHLEQKDYDKDRDVVVAELRQKLKAVVSNATHAKDFDKGLEIARAHRGFVFLAAGIHPEYIEEISEVQRAELFEKIKTHKNEIVAIGETGLDFYWTKTSEWREKQKQYFKNDLAFARNLDKPVTVHARDASAETAQILEEVGYHRVQWHLFHYKELVPLVLKHGWMISVGPMLLTSKTLKKIVRDVPLNQIMLETDSPWWGGRDITGASQRGTPLNIVPVAEKIAEAKGVPFEEVWAACGENATRFFDIHR
ncbi:MAG: TatD family hydrolase [Candidatus Aenigmatarchaeota archaeon]|nr:MAG: TatD family hydrolase [Candidatus Aenigmarchaeota archaeon]